MATTYDLSQISSLDTSSLTVGDIINCPYTGSYKTITLPKGTYKLECWGAQGGYYHSSYPGGKGGYSYGEITINQDTAFYLYAGGQGSYINSSGSIEGGYNGGGTAITSNSSYYIGAGGGGSDIRLISNDLYARVIVAGGGGGAHYNSYNTAGGVGGGVSGIKGTNYSSSYVGGDPGTATSGGASFYQTTSGGTAGSFGQGGYYSTYSTGGGGGWYGGGGARRAGGGGGSGYVYTSGTALQYPSGCLLNSSYYLSNASTLNGATSFTDYSGSTTTGHSGNGAVRITVLNIPKSIYVKTDSTTWSSVEKIYIKIDSTNWAIMEV